MTVVLIVRVTAVRSVLMVTSYLNSKIVCSVVQFYPNANLAKAIQYVMYVSRVLKKIVIRPNVLRTRS